MRAGIGRRIAIVIPAVAAAIVAMWIYAHVTAHGQAPAKIEPPAAAQLDGLIDRMQAADQWCRAHPAIAKETYTCAARKGDSVEAWCRAHPTGYGSCQSKSAPGEPPADATAAERFIWRTSRVGIPIYDDPPDYDRMQK